MGKIIGLVLSVAIVVGFASMGSCAIGGDLAVESRRRIDSYQRELENSIARSSLPSNIQRGCLDSSRSEFGKSAAQIIANTQADFGSDEAVVFLGADYISLSSVLLKPETASIVYQDMDSIRVVPITVDEMHDLRRLIEAAVSGVNSINSSDAEDGLHEVCVVFSSQAKSQNSFVAYRVSDLDGGASPAARAYDLLQSILQK
ncbi:MAG TPA: hypothetical protein VJ800_08850 [Pseudolabrys sp.]|nr:hypothetical protein [Pseudolabrys sp.]